MFRFHDLLGADWKLCARRLGIGRGEFYHAAYRIEQKLGRAFRELDPYPLFPLRSYFGGEVDTRRREATGSLCVVAEDDDEPAITRRRRLLAFPEPKAA